MHILLCKLLSAPINLLIVTLNCIHSAKVYRKAGIKKPTGRFNKNVMSAGIVNEFYDDSVVYFFTMFVLVFSARLLPTTNGYCMT